MGRDLAQGSEVYVGDADKQTNNAKEKTFRTAGFAAFLLLGFTLWQSFLSTGNVYGWPSLLNLLRNEGVYSQKCDNRSICAERTVAFNLVFTVGSATNISGAVLCGVLVDSCGPRGGILTGLVLIMIGSLLMGFSDVESEFAWPLAYAFYGLGGMCVHLSSTSAIQALSVFIKLTTEKLSKGLVISMLVCVFSISALLFQGLMLVASHPLVTSQMISGSCDPFSVAHYH
ncbi:unnamed protein product [Cladocopium goreaui]|uniref:Large neutral amino acids transporter small subunit 3 (L-type amino acid transporter 3) (Prostate cancer overexpressed gene 1 protein) (Solute carrier family 43 member 1) n=1 Tax=Cladocopium goreaui TaxID=2562237 RepID=A0A9P1FNA7_9DINO|nr:unnamed protein product [Cladocopium goreaui]